MGVKAFGFAEKEVGHFTLKKWLLLYGQYKKHHNFKAQGYIFEEEGNQVSSTDEWLPS